MIPTSNLIQGNRGSALLGVLLGGSMIAFVLFCYSYTSADIRRVEIQSYQAGHAQLMAIELMEYLRAMGTSRIIGHLAKNPHNGSTALANLYPLCAHINLLDRVGNNLLNRDPLAETVPNPLLNPGQGTGLSLQANRYYQVQVINIQTQALNSSLCDRKMRNGSGQVLQPSDLMSTDERLFVTVGVTYMPRNPSSTTGSGLITPQSVVLSSIIPGDSP